MSTSNSFQFSTSAPSNIAVIKYWGKQDFQIPCNPSLSLTLDRARTYLKGQVTPKKQNISQVLYEFEGVQRNDFSQRIKDYLKVVSDTYPELKKFDYTFESSNTFPHSSGIASSASCFAAMASLMQEILLKLEIIKEPDLNIVSDLSRKGSGSAARSIFPGWVHWGSASDLYASPLHATQLIHEVFENICDTILIIDSSAKKVASSVGHQMMQDHPYRQQRYAQAKQNFNNILEAIELGDWERFADITEREAMGLHGLMMTANQPYCLLAPQTMACLKKIKNFQSQTKVPLTFTMDAGPNIHLLYPQAYADKVRPWIEHECLAYCENNAIIHDQIGRKNIEVEIES